MWIVQSTTTEVLTPSAIALGNFDGIHLGHQKVIEQIVSRCGDGDIYPTVVTFDPHPREFFTGEKKRLLTPIDEKVEILENLGVKQLVLLPFNEKLARLSPIEFIQQVIVGQLGAKSVAVGRDFRFGRGREGKAGDLSSIGERFGLEVDIVGLKALADDPARVSSSRIREALAGGDTVTAARMLGYPYSLKGRVVEGKKIGRTIGFPTANIEVSENKLLPRLGVYSVRVYIDNEPDWRGGVMNIGRRPTVGGERISVEVHLLDRTIELYDRTLKVSLDAFLRPEHKFASLEELKTRIGEDCRRARENLGLSCKIP